jgi:hypothetical protein
VVDSQELVEVMRIHGKNENFDRQFLGTPIRVLRLTHARSILVTHRVVFRPLLKRTIRHLGKCALNDHPVVNRVQNNAREECSTRPAQCEEHHSQECSHHDLPNCCRQALPQKPIRKMEQTEEN